MFDFAFTDEFHHGGSTDLVLSKIKDLNGPIIHLTGTYHKVESRYTVDDKQIYYWEYSDVQLCKKFKDIKELYEKYGKNIVNSYIKKYKKEYNMTPELLKKMYSLFPDMRYYSIHNNEPLIKPRELFILNKNKDDFASNKIKKLLKNIIDLNNEKSIFNKIKNQEGRTLKKSTGIICFLPSTTGANINEVSKVFEKYILTKYGDIFETIVLNSNKNNNNKKKITKNGTISLDIALINEFERVKNNNKHYLIIVQNMLEAGISLPFVDIIVKLHDSDSYEKNLQQNLRSSTESKIIGDKPYAYIVDYNYNNIFRVLLESLNTKKSKRLSTKEIIKKIVEYKLIVSEDINYSYMDNAIEKIENLEFNFSYTSEKIKIDEEKFEEFDYNWKLDSIKDNNNKTDVAKLQKEIHGERLKIFNLINPDKPKNKKKTETETDPKKEFLKNMKLYTLFFSKLIDYICFLNENDNLKFEKINGLLKYMIKNEKYMNFIKKFFSNNFIKNKIDNLENFQETFKDIIIPDMKNLIIDYNDINNNYINIYNRKMSSIISIEEKVKFIHNLLNPTELTKKNSGEVLTPFELINKMFDQLPGSVWSNSKLKWLDPASGIGNFQIVLLERLMNGLENEFPDYNKREKHILENMIYYGELSTLNTNIYRKIIDPENKYKLNIYNGNSLSQDFKNHMKNIWKVEYFDIIVGNPPYQGTGRKKIHVDFTQLSISILKENGYLLFITPQIIINYLNGIETLQKTINKQYNILYMNGSEKIKQYFNVDSDFVYFLLKKNNNYSSSKIILSNDDEINIKLKFNSVFPFNIKNQKIYNIMSKLVNDNKNEWNRKASRINDGLVDSKTETHKNQIVFKIMTKDIIYKWTNKDHKDMFKYKVLYPTLGNQLIIDKNANLFPGTSFVLYITFETLEECYNFEKLLNTKLFNFLLNIFKNNRSPRDFVIKNLKKVPLIKFDIKSIYKFYKLTEEEINIIENRY
jgi:hypothetical protein